MEMGKLTAKLRDAGPVCLMVDGKEIKRYKNIEIPDELKKLEYQGFKFDVPLNGSIAFKIMFEPGVLPEDRRMRRPLAQEAQMQGEVPELEAQPQDTKYEDFQQYQCYNLSHDNVYSSTIPHLHQIGGQTEAKTSKSRYNFKKEKAL